ncbi:hypothetical protein [Spirosoma fluviale]|uniref:Uncharacterized protein n=1 Tax=Spirosoma fluviale TaxID=1597977 RepID=A0A286GM27_9BACT|nr:hypothetical protein [Spirosoma fluviale]SOD96578.1 hypothetical protein SAMN06269250_5374 [Spirosoma fluviale]
MKKVILSVVGGSLFIAGYYHVHHQAAYLDTQNTQTGFVAPATTPVSPVSLFSLKTIPAFALRSN